MYAVSTRHTMAGARQVVPDEGLSIAPPSRRECLIELSRRWQAAHDPKKWVRPAVCTFVPPMRALITKIAEDHGLTYADIIGPCRTRKVAMVRFDAIAAVYSANPTTMTLPLLGKMFRRDHTTILNALQKRGLWRPKSRLTA